MNTMLLGPPEGIKTGSPDVYIVITKHRPNGRSIRGFLYRKVAVKKRERLRCIEQAPQARRRVGLLNSLRPPVNRRP